MYQNTDAKTCIKTDLSAAYRAATREVAGERIKGKSASRGLPQPGVHLSQFLLQMPTVGAPVGFDLAELIGLFEQILFVDNERLGVVFDT